MSKQNHDPDSRDEYAEADGSPRRHQAPAVLAGGHLPAENGQAQKHRGTEKEKAQPRGLHRNRIGFSRPSRQPPGQDERGQDKYEIHHPHTFSLRREKSASP
ncbi:hypothetical protein [Variovorax sp. KBW07]|uniref:hypothetical protein n=1 Tax=Variovorax sp. KBW07 TaxID=2153358 RepID=UPI000F57168F|nr:hypothetical protein [Variovorax sp. KBW07]